MRQGARPQEKNPNLFLSQVGRQVLELQEGQVVPGAGAHIPRVGRQGVWVPVSW